MSEELTLAWTNDLAKANAEIDRLRASLEWALQALDPLAPDDWWGNFIMAEQHKKACDLVGYVPLKKE